MCGRCMQGGGCMAFRSRMRWLAALVCWGVLTTLTLAALMLPRLHLRPLCGPQLLLHSETAANPPYTSTTASPVPVFDTHVLTEDELRGIVEKRLPSLPLAYWHKHKDDKKKYYKKTNCAPFPSIYQLEFHNTYWQTQEVSMGVFHLYGAYMDRRNMSPIGPAVRLLVMHDRIKPTLKTYCQLWFEEQSAPVIVATLEYQDMWSNDWGNISDHVLQPYLVACGLPKEVRHLTPASVSLVEHTCDRATNHLRVHYDPLPEDEPKRQFAVCVKGLDFIHEDVSVRLVEWIELIKLLGADKIFFYELQLHPNITRVLQYYQARGDVTITPITLPGGRPNLPELQHMYLNTNMVQPNQKRQMELIPYNDCLYRHMYRYRWLVLLDIDEVIVPLEDPDWGWLMSRVLPLSVPAAGKPRHSSYYASNIYFLDSLWHEHNWEESLPRYMHMLQHVYRTRNFTNPGHYVKAFHETERVWIIHSHFPLSCLGAACLPYAMETKHARVHHYRANCVAELSKSCARLRANPARDTTIWRWREPLVSRTDRALHDLGFLPPAKPS